MTPSLYFVENQSPLYEKVQSAGVFEDSKFFPDCSPKTAPTAILQQFNDSAAREQAFDLSGFLREHFDFPPAFEAVHLEKAGNIENHIDRLWPLLTRKADPAGRGTLIPLPHPYIVPGGRFREIYYWDSYFTMLGLKVSGHTELIRNMVDNFASLIDTFGFIPNGNRTYYLSRSQPPFFALMVDLLCGENEEDKVRYFPLIEAEYRFWMEGAESLNAERPAHRRVVRMPNGAILNRYWDDKPEPRPEAYIEDLHSGAQTADAAAHYRHIRAAAESGWDFSSRWFADGKNFATIQTTDLIPVDLNSLLYYMEKALYKTCKYRGDDAKADVYKDLYERRAAAVIEYCWDEDAGYFTDYQWVLGQLNRQYSAAGVFPLFVNLVKEKSRAETAWYFVQKNLLKAGGIVSTLYSSGQQWDAPNGWAPQQWTAFQGFANYGISEACREIKNRWTALNEKVYASTGKMMEKYNVEDTHLLAGGGEYPNQDGFGWTNGVYLALKHSGF